MMETFNIVDLVLQGFVFLLVILFFVSFFLFIIRFSVKSLSWVKKLWNYEVNKKFTKGYKICSFLQSVKKSHTCDNQISNGV